MPNEGSRGQYPVSCSLAKPSANRGSSAKRKGPFPCNKTKQNALSIHLPGGGMVGEWVLYLIHTDLKESHVEGILQCTGGNLRLTWELPESSHV